MVAIVPATANLIAKLALGLADDLLTNVALATRAPLVIAPAMNSAMLEHPATQANLATLRARGATIVEPEVGFLAEREHGPGRLAGEDALVAALAGALERRRDLAGERVLITAGPTREPIDPVRFLSNAATGTQGIELAREALARGAEVELVLGPTALAAAARRAHRAGRHGARDGGGGARARAARATIAIATAAVADWRPAVTHQHKVKKTDGPQALALERTPDILAGLGAQEHAGLFLVGFAAETEAWEASRAREAGPQAARRDRRQRRRRRARLRPGRQRAGAAVGPGRPARSRRRLQARAGRPAVGRPARAARRRPRRGARLACCWRSTSATPRPSWSPSPTTAGWPAPGASPPPAAARPTSTGCSSRPSSRPRASPSTMSARSSSRAWCRSSTGRWPRAARSTSGCGRSSSARRASARFEIRTERPADVGSDLAAAAIGAVELVGAPAIVVNFGTATTFGAVDRAGAYVGVAIAPGIQVAFDALVGRTAKLPQVALEAPPSPIGRETVSALQSGVVFGAVGQTEGIVARMRRELGADTRVIASGGLAPIVARETSVIERVEPHLVPLGLRADWLRRER